MPPTQYTTHNSELRAKKRIIFLVGPTAVGKSEIAVRLAPRLDAEIISCDSIQLYQGMDILSNQPDKATRGKVQHHLISSVKPNKEYNVAGYRNEAIKKIKALFKRGKTPLFVGGTGLYVSILLDGIFKAKSENKALRQRLFQESEKLGNNYLHNKLKKIDPEAAQKIHPHDKKRIIRALEVFAVCGKPISQLQKSRKGLWGTYDVRVFGLDMPRAQLYARINQRSEKMFKFGLITEVRRLLKTRLSKTSRYAIGIKELKGYFSGQYDLAEAKRQIQQNTRHFAKRQLTWFRKDKRIEWIGIKEGDKPQKITEKILQLL